MTISMPESAATMVRSYAGLAGVDFSSNPNMVALNRSPDAKNIYKNYKDDMGQAIETRPGFIKLGKVSSHLLFGIHIFKDTCLIHHSHVLTRWNNFPNPFTDADLTDTNIYMGYRFSSSFIFNNAMYIIDGSNYLRYDDTTVINLMTSDECYIPTTRIGADPDGGNGVTYQPVNLLTSRRKNSFVADGSSKVYRLDATSVSTPIKIWIDGEEQTSGFSYSTTSGTVTFTTAPTKPSTPGQDNVIIEFGKSVSGNSSKITKCTIAKVFDNRVFLSGNPDLPGTVFHSELNDPTYFSDTGYFTDGDDGAAVTALVQGYGSLIVLKEDRLNGSKVYIHTPTMVYTDTGDANSETKAYPRTETEITVGGSCAINFMDDIVFVSPLGVKGIQGGNGLALQNRSSLIDTRLIAEPNLSKARMEVWNNYLMIYVDDKVYMADSRQKFQGPLGMEYEWYYWDNIGLPSGSTFYPIQIIKEYEGDLYFGSTNTNICKFEGTSDDGRLIDSYWTTPPDYFGTMSRYKNIMKKGGVIEIKRMDNAAIKLDIQTNKDDEFKNVLSATTKVYFTFEEFSFSGLQFGSDIKGVLAYQPKRKKIKSMTLKFYSDTLDMPFGVYGASLEAEIQNYIKG